MLLQRNEVERQPTHKPANITDTLHIVIEGHCTPDQDELEQAAADYTPVCPCELYAEYADR